jgi:hypothetical protein
LGFAASTGVGKTHTTIHSKIDNVRANPEGHGSVARRGQGLGRCGDNSLSGPKGGGRGRPSGAQHKQSEAIVGQGGATANRARQLPNLPMVKEN